MQKLTVSVLFSLALGGLILAGIEVRNSGEANRACQKLARELSALEVVVAGARDEIQALHEQVRQIESDETARASLATPSVTGAAVQAVAKEGTSSPAMASMYSPEELRAFVFAAIAEDRKLEDEERQRREEEMRQRFEERRNQFAALREGPYERFNLKVNSLAKVLQMNQSQQQAYFALSKQYSDKYEEGRKQLDEARREARRAQQGAAEGGEGGAAQDRGPGRKREDRDTAYRELSERLQTEFASQLPGVLTPSQLSVYSQLSPSAQSFQGTEYVSAPGEESPFARFGGGMPGLGGARGLGGNRGGRGR